MSAADELTSELMGQIDDNQVSEIILTQRDSLARFEKTNEMLSNCCKLSSTRLESASRELTWYTNTVNDMKKDLDSIFRRIRLYKQKMVQLYGENVFDNLKHREIASGSVSDGDENTCGGSHSKK